MLVAGAGCGALRIPGSAAASNHVMILRLTIENMHCGACVRRVMQTLNALPGTHADEVRVGSAQVRSEAAPQAIAEALTSAGYPARVQEAAS